MQGYTAPDSGRRPDCARHGAVSSPARRNPRRAAQRPLLRLVASVLAVAGLLGIRAGGSPLLAFSSLASRYRSGSLGAFNTSPHSSGRSVAAVRRRAAGFKSPKKKRGGKGFTKGPGEASIQKRPDSASDGLAKDENKGKSKALSTSKLRDLRDKTLALRQKREAEIDEYETGRAMIAKYGPKVSVMPDKVAKRVAKRGMVIGGAFYGVMLATFAGGIIIYRTQDIIIPPTLMGFITLFLLGLAILGSAFGMTSASWDPDKQGSLLGLEEFGSNVKAIGEGFRRFAMQTEYEKAVKLRGERRKLLEAKEEKKKELLNK